MSAAGAQEPAVDESKETEAKAMFEAGRTAFEAERYKDALQRWEVAFRLSGRPAIRYNLGLAHERLGQIDQAIAAFENYLKWDPEGQRAMEVRGKLQSLRAGQRDQPSPALEEPTAEPAAPSEDQNEAPSMTPGPSQALSRPESEADAPVGEASGMTMLGWILTGGGAVMIASSLVTGALAMSAEDDLETSCMDGACPQTLADTADDATQYALLTDVLWISGAAVAGVGITLLLIQEDGPEQASLNLRIVPGGLVVGGTL